METSELQESLADAKVSARQQRI